MDEVLSVFSDNGIKLGLVQETWFSSQTNLTTSVIKSAGFNIVHNFRTKRGGGVCILWHQTLDKQIKIAPTPKHLSTFQYQNLFFHGKFKINLITIYRFQETSFSLFLQELNSLLSDQDPAHPLVLTGDFNVHFEDSSSGNVKKLIDITSSFGLSQFVVGPSHKFGHTLDLLFANSFDFQMQGTEPVSYNLSDHFPIFFELPNGDKQNTVNDKKTVTLRDLKNVNIPSLASDLGASLNCAITGRAENSSFGELVEVYNNILECELNKVAPVQTRTFPINSSPPWLDDEYRANRATRRRLERAWKKSRLAVDKNAYVTQRKLCAKMCVDKRSTYYKSLIASKKGDQRALYSIVNRLFDKNKSSVTLPEHSNASELANRFNNFYTDKVSKLRSKITPVDHTPRINNNFSGTVLNSFRPTTESELRVILKKSGIKTSFHDKLPANILKQVIEELLPHLCAIINKSLLTGSCDGMKESTIVPLLKKAGLDPEILKNYRPVADLVFLSKLSERVVEKQMSEHMSMNNLHSKHQHGYKIYHSTETLIVCIVNDVLIAFDNQNGVILLLIDLSAAFDTVDIAKLVHILESEIGIQGLALKWLESFLRGRKQRVLIGQSLSDSHEVQFGVPQGSVLGPILFNIYIRSLFDVIKVCGFSTSGYADDNNAHQSFALHFQYDLVNVQLPNLMSQIKHWMDEHFLKINPDKTEIIAFLPENMRSKPTINGAFLEGECIRFSNVVKNLGFNLDRFLDMDYHVNLTVSLCYKLLSDVARVRHLLSDSDTESLVHSIVSSRLDYCNSVLFGINKCLVQKYQNVQNYAARIISKRKKCQSVRDVLEKLHWLPVERRIIFKLLTFTFKILNGMAPECLNSLISIKNADLFLLNNVYLDSYYGRRSFKYTSPRFWNALPFNIRSSNTLDSFKRLTKHHLFNNFSAFKSTAFIYHNVHY